MILRSGEDQDGPECGALKRGESRGVRLRELVKTIARSANWTRVARTNASGS